MPPPDPAGEAEADAYFEWLLREVEAGREAVPDGPSPPRAVISLADACDVDLTVVGAMTGPGGLAGPGFRQGEMADMMRPGPVLDALAGQAVAEAGSLTDDALLGVISAARRMQAYHEHLELAGIAEYAARNQARHEASKARGDKRLRRDGEYAAEELGFELLVSRQAAGQRLDLADGLARRLPRTFAGMAAGVISGQKAAMICRRTWYLSDADAAAADEVLAAAAPGLRPDSVGARAARLAQRLDPEAAKRHKEEAKAARRVEIRQEASGNATLAGRELDSAEVLAAKSAIWAEAARRRTAGTPGTLAEIRARVYMDRLLGAAPAAAPVITPFPALINVIAPAGTLLGWSDAMGQAGGLGLLDAGDTRAVVEAASLHPATRWCVTLTDETTGQATAHGCARGRHPWKAPAGPAGRADLAGLLRDLKVTFEPIARGTCDHRHRESRYLPSRKLRHLMLARTTTCPGRGCEAQGLHNEADHTITWPDGDTDECNLSPPCGRHHHAKHAPGWKLEQPEPGLMRWTTPSGRVYTTTPDTYET
jgi:hypothetical protein